MTSNVHPFRRPASAQLALAVRSARVMAGLSQLRASLDVGCDLATLKAWERGERRPDVAKLLEAPKVGPAFAAELSKLVEARRAA